MGAAVIAGAPPISHVPAPANFPSHDQGTTRCRAVCKPLSYVAVIALDPSVPTLMARNAAWYYKRTTAMRPN